MSNLCGAVCAVSKRDQENNLASRNLSMSPDKPTNEHLQSLASEKAKKPFHEIRYSNFMPGFHAH